MKKLQYFVIYHEIVLIRNNILFILSNFAWKSPHELNISQFSWIRPFLTLKMINFSIDIQYLQKEKKQTTWKGVCWVDFAWYWYWNSFPRRNFSSRSHFFQSIFFLLTKTLRCYFWPPGCKNFLLWRFFLLMCLTRLHCLFRML